jgi:hypothetical protein
MFIGFTQTLVINVFDSVLTNEFMSLPRVRFDARGTERDVNARMQRYSGEFFSED